MNRRSLLAALCVLPKLAYSKIYNNCEVSYFFYPTNGLKALVAFEQYNSSWHNPAIINKVANSYINKGLILKKSFKIEDEYLTWVYLFLNRAAFESWQYEVIAAGGFNHENLNSEFKFEARIRYI